MQYETQLMAQKRLSVNTVCELLEQIYSSQSLSNCAVPVDDLLRLEQWPSCQEILGTSYVETG